MAESAGGLGDSGLGDSGEVELGSVELFHGYPAPLLQFASLCCVAFMLLGIPGNLITIVALAKCKKVRNATAVFIMNLSCSDLLFCCFNLPLAASTFWRRAWTHGPALCTMFPLARYALVAVSLFTVLAITINRYVMISHPTLYPKVYRGAYLALMVALTWACAFGALVATYLGRWGRFGLDPAVGSCSILPDRHGRSPKEALFVGAFLLPCLAILVCYARIFCIVRRAARRSRAPLRRSTNCLEDSAVGSASTAVDKSPALGQNGSHNQYQTKKGFLAPPAAVHGPGPPTPGPERSSSSGVDTLDGHEEEAGAGGFGGGGRGAPTKAEGGETARRLRQAAAALRRSPLPGAAGAPPHAHAARPPRLTHKDRKLLKMIMVIMISFWVCYLPITLTKISRDLTSSPWANIAGYLLIYLTTCINPVIYVVMSSEYRQAYKNLLMCRRRA